jgi:crotonobetainyl-CoA:carnitine CoA-transferase CaiB-like acyl-CoA transferase
MATEAHSTGPLKGVRVLDLSSIIMGPYATQILADYGAEVIMVEPLSGGGNRGMGPGPHPQFSGIALNVLRNKRSVSLDMKDAAARGAVLALAKTCDILVTNLRPKPLGRLGLDYDAVRKVRPDIIFCQAQGFRSDGPRADDPAYDDIIQAESGIADAARRADGAPRLAPTIVADKVCGMAIAGAVTAALVHRLRTGQGQRVEVPMIDVAKSFVLVEHGAGAIAGPGGAGYSRVLARERGPQATLDGWINILPYSSKAFDALFSAGGREDLVGDPKTRGRGIMLNADFLYGQLRPIIATRTTEAWLAFCNSHQIPVGSVATLDDLVAGLPTIEHPDVGSYHSIPAPIWFSETPCDAPRPAHRIGQDTRAALAEAGLSDDAINDLIQRRAARTAATDAPPPHEPSGDPS